jgi:hypothetical protein
MRRCSTVRNTALDGELEPALAEQFLYHGTTATIAPQPLEQQWSAWRSIFVRCHSDDLPLDNSVCIDCVRDSSAKFRSPDIASFYD